VDGQQQQQHQQQQARDLCGPGGYLAAKVESLIFDFLKNVFNIKFGHDHDCRSSFRPFNK
jgi:hypothetical protein